MRILLKNIWIFALAAAVSGGFALAAGDVDLSAHNSKKAYYHFMKGVSLEMGGNLAAAEKEYRKVMLLDPGSYYPYLKTAELLAGQYDYDGAVKMVRRSLEIEDTAAGRKLLARIYWRKGYSRGQDDSLLNRAETSYREAVKLGGGPEAYLELSKLLKDRKKYEKALDTLTELLDAHPNTAMASRMIAEIYRETGETEKAVAALKEALRANPNNFEALMTLAGYSEKRNDLKKAAEYYERALQVVDFDLKLQTELGRIYLEMGESEKAAGIFREVIEFDFGNDRVRRMLADALRNTGRYEDANEYYLKLLENNPLNIDHRYAYAESLRLQGKLEEALVNYEVLMEEMKSREGDSPMMKRILMEVESRIALLNMHVGDMDTAVKRLEEMVESYKKPSVDIYVMLASAYVDGGLDDKAEGLIGDALEVHPKNLQLRMLEVDFYENTGRIEEARDRLEKMLDADSRPARFYVFAAGFHIRREMFEKAVDVLNRGIEEHPENEHLYFQLGAAQERRGLYGEARKAFHKTLDLNPRNAQALNYLGYMMVEKGDDLDKAVEMIKSALEIDGNNAAYLDSLGWAYYKKGGNLKKSRELLERAVEKEEDPVIYDHLGDVYSELGITGKAAESWERALELGIDHPEKVKDKLARTKND